MSARRLLIAAGIFALVLACLMFFNWQAARHYHRPRTSQPQFLHYVDVRSAQEAGEVEHGRFPAILPANSTELNVWFSNESYLSGSFTFPVQDLAALKERARQISSAVIDDSPIKGSLGEHYAVVTYSDQGSAFRLIISPSEKDPKLLHALWERKRER